MRAWQKYSPKVMVTSFCMQMDKWDQSFWEVRHRLLKEQLAEQGKQIERLKSRVCFERMGFVCTSGSHLHTCSFTFRSFPADNSMQVR